VSEDCGMTGVRPNCRLDGTRNFISRFLSRKKLNVLGPRQRNQDSNASGGALIQKPTRRRMINPHDVDADFAHLRKIALHLFLRAQIMTFRVRFEGTVSDALQKEFAVAFEKELS